MTNNIEAEKAWEEYYKANVYSFEPAMRVRDKHSGFMAGYNAALAASDHIVDANKMVQGGEPWEPYRVSGAEI